jgi:hypothetical protein
VFDGATAGNASAENSGVLLMDDPLKTRQMSCVSSATLGLNGPTNAKDVNTKAPDAATNGSGETSNLPQQNYYDGTAIKKEIPKSGIIDRRELEFNYNALLTAIVSSAGHNSRRPTNIEFQGDSIKIFRGGGHTCC